MFICEYCNKKYKTESGLNTHIKKYHYETDTNEEEVKPENVEVVEKMSGIIENSVEQSKPMKPLQINKKLKKLRRTWTLNRR